MPDVGRHGIRDRSVHMVAWDRPSPCPCGPQEVPNIEHWVPTLVNNFRIDHPASQKLRDLAAMRREGYMHANGIIGKLIKKVNDWIELDNPSAFVTAGMKAAHRTIRDKRS